MSCDTNSCAAHESKSVGRTESTLRTTRQCGTAETSIVGENSGGNDDEKVVYGEEL